MLYDMQLRHLWYTKWNWASPAAPQSLHSTFCTPQHHISESASEHHALRIRLASPPFPAPDPPEHMKAKESSDPCLQEAKHRPALQMWRWRGACASCAGCSIILLSIMHVYKGREQMADLLA